MTDLCYIQAVREHWAAKQAAAAAAAAAAMQRTLSDEAPVVGVRFEVTVLSNAPVWCSSSAVHAPKLGSTGDMCTRTRHSQ